MADFKKNRNPERVMLAIIYVPPIFCIYTQSICAKFWFCAWPKFFIDKRLIYFLQNLKKIDIIHLIKFSGGNMFKKIKNYFNDFVIDLEENRDEEMGK